MTSISPPVTGSGDSPKGLAFAVTAYVMWGFLPLYLKSIDHIPTSEVLAHRILWSVPVAGLLLWWQGQLGALAAAMRNSRMLAMTLLTAGLITLNWGIYVYAVTSGHALDAALGYYINPLFSVGLGATVLRERLERLQWVAIAVAAFAVAILTVENGRLPVAALGMTLTFGLYGFLKKQLPIGPNEGFMLEVLVLLPVAAGWLIWLSIRGGGHFLTGSTHDTLLLGAAGVVTAMPLMAYANGAKLLRLSTIGILQYIAPTMIFLSAVFLFGEPFGGARLIAFPMIWAALAIYTFAMFRAARRH